MVNLSRVVRARSRDDIEEEAWRARANLGLTPFDRVPVAHLIEHVLPEVMPGFEYRVDDDQALGPAEAITDNLKRMITFSARCYNGILRGVGRSNMTAIHELGHLLMHTGQRAGYTFTAKYDPAVDPERQADIFAGAFMMPECAFRQVKTIKEAMVRFGVSKDAACFRARTLKMGWLIQGRSAPRRTKKKGYSKRRTP